MELADHLRLYRSNEPIDCGFATYRYGFGGKYGRHGESQSYCLGYLRVVLVLSIQPLGIRLGAFGDLMEVVRRSRKVLSFCFFEFLLHSLQPKPIIPQISIIDRPHAVAGGAEVVEHYGGNLTGSWVYPSQMKYIHRGRTVFGGYGGSA